jgi:aspartyl-tRNA(Asn)/glutamyl-tRNA(Gln) amidotransferase subunit C
MNINDIRSLANLARLRISNNEEEKLVNDFDSILHYIDRLKEADAPKYPLPSIHANQVRDDRITCDSGINHEVLLGESPQVRDGFVEVHKMFS